MHFYNVGQIWSCWCSSRTPAVKLVLKKQDYNRLVLHSCYTDTVLKHRMNSSDTWSGDGDESESKRTCLGISIIQKGKKSSSYRAGSMYHIAIILL